MTVEISSPVQDVQQFLEERGIYGSIIARSVYKANGSETAWWESE